MNRRPSADRRRALALSLVALAAAAIAALHHLEARAERRAAVAEAAALGLSERVDPERVRRTSDPARARLAVARAALAASIEGDAEGGSRERLERARGLAAGAWRRRPASWEAATTAGAATYLAWSIERDERLFLEHARWESPLEVARTLAPRRREADRFLAAAYLELWPALAPEKRQRARTLAAAAFEDPRLLERLFEPWLQVTGGTEPALAVVPDRPESWRLVGRTFAARADWAGFCAVHERWREAIATELETALEHARRARAGGSLLEARRLYLGLVAEAPRDRAFAPLVANALAEAPFGPLQPEREEPLAEWLEWSVELCELGDCPLPAPALRRLAAALGRRAPSDPERLALLARAAIATGDEDQAAQLEAASPTLVVEAWTPYFLAAARSAADAGRVDAARAALAQVPPAGRSRVDFHWTQAAVARSAGDRAAARAGRLAALAADRDAFWRRRGSSIGRRFVVPIAAGEWQLGLAEVPADGAAVELSLDGDSLGCYPVATGGAALRPATEVPAGLHRLDLATLAGGGLVWPGRPTIPTRRSSSPSPDGRVEPAGAVPAAGATRRAPVR